MTRRTEPTFRLALPAAAAVLLATGCGGERPGPTGPTPTNRVAPTLERLTVEPFVIDRASGSFQVRAWVNRGDVAALQTLRVDLQSIYAQAPPSANQPRHHLLVGGAPVTAITLRDDGLEGDAQRGDRVFTSPPITPVAEIPEPFTTFFPLISEGFAWAFADTVIRVTLTGADRLLVSVIDATVAALPPVTVRPVGADIQQAPHVVSFTLPPATLLAPLLGRSASEISRRYLGRFGYEPDFLLVIHPGVRRVDQGLAAFYAPVRNVTGGIGSEQFDQGPLYGATGTLQGVISIYGTVNPDGHGLLIHEIGHRWMAHLDPALGLSSNSHWGPGLARTDHAFRGGPFNDFELYLMGLLPADSVLPSRIGVNGLELSAVIQRHGERTPAWPLAPREFTLATVVAAERPLTGDELLLLDFYMAEFSRASADPRRGPGVLTFEAATGGRARLVTRIPDEAAR